MHRQTDDKIARIEQIHAALRESIEAVKLLADEADTLVRRGRDPPAEQVRPEPKPRMPG